MATTLTRAAFAAPIGHKINLKILAIGTYVVGSAIAVGNILCTITQLLPNNQVRAQVTGGPASGTLLLPKGTNVV